ncbi:MAG: hypothetical protein Q7S30_00575 [Candidatus Omnitrophota bacterium]|nr:hypothetical protein [Candidatus Omnitrophota bacterium]
MNTRSDEAKQRVIGLAMEDLAGLSGANKDDIKVLSAEEATWSSGALGFEEPGFGYTDAIEDGYKITLSCSGKEYEYHTSMRNVKLDPKIMKRFK